MPVKAASAEHIVDIVQGIPSNVYGIAIADIAAQTENSAQRDAYNGAYQAGNSHSGRCFFSSQNRKYQTYNAYKQANNSTDSYRKQTDQPEHQRYDAAGKANHSLYIILLIHM